MNGLAKETLLELAQAAEWMADNSEHTDRGGRCSAYLLEAARQARKVATPSLTSSMGEPCTWETA